MLAWPNFKRLEMQPVQLTEGELIDITKENSCDKKDTDVSEEVNAIKRSSC